MREQSRTLRRTTTTLGMTVAMLAATAPAALAHGDRPAGGAPLEDLVAAGVVALILTAAVVAFGWAHRTGRTTLLATAAAMSERVSGLAGFAALPAAITGISLLLAVFGFYWDVATHIDNGRDPGPFANPSHWFILIGLLGIALAGVTALLIGVEERHPAAIRLRRGWHVPVGGLLLGLCGVVALLGFPLDDVWHRIFGQDVTLWSPTHIQMVGGASLSTLALWVLVEEGRLADPPGHELAPRLRGILLAGAFLLGASTLQGEFDYAVPQFRLLYQPVLIVVATAVALVPARIRLGRGGALAATLVFLAARGLLTVLITPVLGSTSFHFPLYLGAALAVEIVALRWPPERQVRFGALAGLGVGTLGLAVEWGWSRVAMPIPWTSALLPEAVLVAVPAAVTAGVVGGFIGRALTPASQRREQVPRWVAPLSGVVLLSTLAYPMPMTEAPGAAASVRLADVRPAPDREVQATIRLEPRELAAGAEYVNVTVWQGSQWTRSTSFVDPLEQVGEGVYRTTRPIPVHGSWKALIRVQRDAVNIAAPIFLPEDQAIPAEEVPAEAAFTREFQPNRELLLREAKDVPGWLTLAAHVALGLLLAAWVAAIGWGLRRLRRSREPGAGDDGPTDGGGTEHHDPAPAAAHPG